MFQVIVCLSCIAEEPLKILNPDRDADDFQNLIWAYLLCPNTLICVAVSDVTINTTDASYTDSTGSFSAITCVVLRAHTCPDGAVALTTTTSSYTTDVYVLYLEGPKHSQFANSEIYAK